MATSEEEEFEFRRRAEAEAAARPKPQSIGDRIIGAADAVGQSLQDFTGKHGRSLATIAGGTIGGALAAPPAAVAGVPTLGLGSLATEAGGVGLGAGIGGQIYDRASDFMANRRTPLPQQMQTAATDIASNAAAVPVGQMIGKTAANVAKPTGQALAALLGKTTGAGGRALQTAASAGYQGGIPAQTFRANISGDVPVENVVKDVQGKLSTAYQARNADYQMRIAPISQDTQKIPFTDIQQAVADTANRGAYKGKVIDTDAQRAWQDISAKVTDWQKSGLNTPGDLDALKKSIGDTRSGYQPGSPAFNVADTIYKAVEDTISAKAPDYAKLMEDYSGATDSLRDIRSGLSLNNRSGTPAKLGKLLQAMKGTTGAGAARGELLDKLLGPNDQTVAPALAGQALNPAFRGGLGGVAVGAGEFGAGVLGQAAHNPEIIASALAAGLTTSPRIAGEIAYGGGKLAGKVAPTFQQMAKSPAARAAMAAYLANALNNRGQP